LIEVRIQKGERKRVKVSVTDNGCGIAKEDLEKVFELGYSTKERDGFKHGAGLFLVKWYADQMKAELNIESTVGVGTTVSMSLPKAK
jgi:signal transduction histidine kinase